MELCEIALIKIFPADEPTDEIVMQPAHYFPPDIEHNSPLQIHKHTNTQAYKHTNTHMSQQMKL